MKKTFRRKMFIVLLLVLFISSLGVSYIWYFKSRSMITDEVFKSTKILVEERNKDFEKAIKDLDYMSMSISANNLKVSRVISNKWEDAYLRIQSEKKLQEYMDSLYGSRNYISTIIISNTMGDIYKRGSSINDDYILNQSFYNTLKDKGLERIIVPYYDKYNNVKEIFIIRNIIYNEKIIGYSIVGMSYDYLKEIFDKNLPQNSLLFIKNDKGDNIYKNFTDDYQNLLLETEKIKIEENGYKLTNINREKYLVIKFNSDYTKFKLTAVVPTKKMFADVNKTLNNILVLIFVGMGALVFLVNFISREISKNIQILSEGMRSFSEGNLEAKVNIKSQDELGELGHSFNDMTERIQNLLNNIKENEKEKVNLEIKALQGQINMHFLFNTLNTIKDLCYIQRVTNVEKLVNSLMQLLHISMGKEDGLIALKKEIEYIEHYLEIYRYKHLDNIQCFINVDEDIMECMVLKFILQPIVENSIIHGFEDMTENVKGVIYIKGAIEEGDIRITIIDNGKGFKMEDENKNFTGIGIANVDKRIKMNFGQRYGITIKSILNTSTTVELLIPYIRGNTND